MSSEHFEVRLDLAQAVQVAKDTEWGDDADRWVADRFLRSEKKGHMMPFGGGVSMVSRSALNL